MVQFDMPPGQARALINQALEDLQPDTGSGGRRHEIPVWYDASVGPGTACAGGPQRVE